MHPIQVDIQQTQVSGVGGAGGDLGEDLRIPPSLGSCDQGKERRITGDLVLDVISSLCSRHRAYANSRSKCCSIAEREDTP